MLAFFYLMGTGFSLFFLELVVINLVNSSDSFLDNFVITCKFFFSHRSLSGSSGHSISVSTASLLR